MNFGFSEAQVFIGTDSVLKVTPQAQSQVQMLRELGASVCPRVLSTTKDSYTMEKLRQPNPRELFQKEVIYEVHNLLKKIHSRPAVYSSPFWQELLKEFLEPYDKEAAKLVDELYPMNERLRYCLIHGDPTLANVMYRCKQMLLIDPVKPRGKVPSLREVDYGKMLQSALGWEGIQQKIPYRSKQLIVPVLEQIENKNKAWFWAAVNIIRLFPRAQKRLDIVSWGKYQINYCWENMK